MYQQRGDYFRSFNTGDPYYDTGGIYDFGGDPVANDFDGRETTNWSVEARYATPAEGRWSAIVGGFYNRPRSGGAVRLQRLQLHRHPRLRLHQLRRLLLQWH